MVAIQQFWYAQGIPGARPCITNWRLRLPKQKNVCPEKSPWTVSKTACSLYVKRWHPCCNSWQILRGSCAAYSSQFCLFRPLIESPLIFHFYDVVPKFCDVVDVVFNGKHKLAQSINNVYPHVLSAWKKNPSLTNIWAMCRSHFLSKASLYHEIILFEGLRRAYLLR